MLLDRPTNVDLDDMFGVRRALEGLPPPLRDPFLQHWCEITQATPGDLAAICTAVRREAMRRALRDGDHDPVTGAWKHVSEAMTRYLAWSR